MISIKWISVLLLLQRSQSYILLTANLDDVQAVVKQISESHVSDQITKILRRASSIFNQQLRAVDDKEFSGSPSSYPRVNSQTSDSSVENLQNNNIRGQSYRSNWNAQGRRQNSPSYIKNKDTTPRDVVSDHAVKQTSIAPSNYKGKETQKELDPHLSYLNKDGLTDEETHSVKDFNELHTIIKEKENGQGDESQNESHEKRQGKKKPKENGQVEESHDESHEERRGEKKLMENDQAQESHDESQEKRQGEDPYDAKRHHTDELVALGKNASFHLNSIKQIMENVA